MPGYEHGSVGERLTDNTTPYAVYGSLIFSLIKRYKSLDQSVKCKVNRHPSTQGRGFSAQHLIRSTLLQNLTKMLKRRTYAPITPNRCYALCFLIIDNYFV